MTEPAKDANEFTLVISEKGGAERRQTFRSAEVAIGRVPGNDIVLAKGNVSKKHARLLFREGRLIVTDLNSTNGTFVNRRRISQATIVRPEDRLFIGDYVFRVELTGGNTDAVLSLDTPERLIAPPLPSNTVLKLGGDVETVSLATLVPAPDRITEPPSARSASGSSPRKSETAEPSGRLEPSILRGVVAGIVNSVLGARGETPPEMDDLAAQLLGDQVATLVDQLLVDGQIPVGVSGETVHDVAVLELVGLGPLEALLDDISVSAVSASRYDELVELRDGRLHASQFAFSCPRAFDLAVTRLLHRAKAAPQGSDSSTKTSFVRGGHRWHAEFARVGQSWIFNLERTNVSLGSADDWVLRGVLSRAMASFLSAAMQARLNLLIVATIPSDARALVQVLLAAATRERVFWLGPSADVGSGRMTLLDLPPGDREHLGALRLAASLPLARLVFANTDEVAWPTVLEHGPMHGASLLCMADGADLGRVVGRMPADLMRKTPGLSMDVASSWVRSAFDLAVEVSRHIDGRIRITRIAEVQADLLLSDVFAFQVTRTLSGGAAEGSFVQVAKDPHVFSLFQAAGLRPDQVLPARSTDPGELK